MNFDELIQDSQMIKDEYYLNTNQFKEVIKELLLKNETKFIGWRKLLIILTSLYKNNEIIESINLLHLLINIQEIFKFLEIIEIKTFYNNFQPFPPYDLFILICLLSIREKDEDSQQYFYLLFNFYKNIYLEIKNSNLQFFFINDKYLYSNIKQNKIETLKCLEGRLTSIIENLSILYYQMPPNTLLNNFLYINFPYDNIDQHLFLADDFLYSLLGRLSLSNGEKEISNNYFKLIKNSLIKESNRAFIDFFNGNFLDALDGFKKNQNPISQINLASCLVYLGEIDQAINTLKLIKNKELKLNHYVIVNENLKFLENLLNINHSIKSKIQYNFPLNTEPQRNPH